MKWIITISIVLMGSTTWAFISDILPQNFSQYFYLSATATITPIAYNDTKAQAAIVKKDNLQRVSIENNGGTTSTITSGPCKENSDSSRCIGVLESGATETFTMMQIHFSDREKNSITKCKSKYTKNQHLPVPGELELNGCKTFTEKACERWFSALSAKAGSESHTNLIAALTEDIKKCQDTAKKINDLKEDMKNAFSPQTAKLRANMVQSYDEARNGNPTMQWQAKLVKTDAFNENPVTLITEDLTQTTETCVEAINAGYFNSTQERLQRVRSISLPAPPNTSAVARPTPAASSAR